MTERRFNFTGSPCPECGSMLVSFKVIPAQEAFAGSAECSVHRLGAEFRIGARFVRVRRALLKSCLSCGWSDRIPLDPDRPEGRCPLAFIGLHRWEMVGVVGIHEYAQCSRCGERTARSIAPLHNPRDEAWLDGAPWGWSPLRTPPAGLREPAKSPPIRIGYDGG